LLGRQFHWPTITNDLVTELFWHVWGSCKRPYDNKSVSSLLLASFLSSLQASDFFCGQNLPFVTNPVKDRSGQVCRKKKKKENWWFTR
jgi:hypothetical protein